MRISDWSSDVCSSDLAGVDACHVGAPPLAATAPVALQARQALQPQGVGAVEVECEHARAGGRGHGDELAAGRSEEHPSEIKSLLRTSYAVFWFIQNTTSHTTSTILITMTSK